jgi:hypothetical protein
LTERPFRPDRGLQWRGQAAGTLLLWWGLGAFCAVSPISIAATNMAWVAALLGLLYHAVVNRDPRAGGLVQRTDLDPALLCFFCASFLAVFFSLDILTSLIEFRSLGLMVIFYLFAGGVKTTGQRKTLVRILLAASFVSALYGWVQFLTGWDLLGHYRPETRKVCGLFGLHLTYGEYLSMVICAGVGTLLWGDTSGVGRVAKGLLFGCIGSAVVLSGSKGALLSLVVGLGVVFALRGRKALAFYLAGGILLCVALDILMSHRLWGNLVALLQIGAGEQVGPAASNTHRLCMWWTGLWISLGHFLYGVGLHAVGKIYPAFRHPLAIEPNQWHLHNNFVHLGVTRGMMGLAAFLYIFLRVFRLGFYWLRAGLEGFDRGLAAGVLGGSAAFLVAGLTEYNWGDSEVLMLLYLLFGLLASSGKQPAAGPSPQHALPVNGPGAVLRAGSLSFGRTLIFLLLVAGICCLAFVIVPPSRSLRMGLWQALVGVVVILFALWGKNRASGGLPVWQRQVCGGLALCAGVHFTQVLWDGKHWAYAPPWFVWVGLTGFLLLCLCCGLLTRDYLKRRDPSVFVDLAGIGALTTWAVLALVTFGLLRMAGWTDSLSGPPYTPVLLLAALSAALYGGVRFTYRGAGVERLLLAVLGLCTLIHVFR